MRPTAKSYFSGAGGMDLGLLDAGIDVIQSLDIDRQSCETLRQNFSHAVLETDISKVTVLDQPKSDIISLTFPCTKYSAIADIHGTRTGDDLFLHAFRHVALEQPEAFVVENVPGMKKFRVVMECFEKIPDYYVTTLCPLDASNWLPQRRARLILIGTKRENFITAPKAQRRKTLREIIEKDARVNITDSVIARLKGEYRDLPIISDPDKDDLAPTCVAHYAKDRGTRLVKDATYKYGARPYTVREYARLQGFPDSHKFAGSENQQMTQIGNAVAVDVARWIGQNLYNYFNKN